MSSSEGSSGKMEEVIALCLKKNPETRFVVNLITPESLAAVLEAVKTLPVTEPDLLTLTAARSKSRLQSSDDGAESGVDRDI